MLGSEGKGTMARQKKEQGESAALNPDSPLQNPSARLGEILLEKRIITQEQLDEGLAKQAMEGGFLGQKLIELKHLDQQTLTLLLVKQCKIPHLNLLDYHIDRDVVELIPKDLCLKHKILPVDKMGRILTVAMIDPLNVEALAAIRDQFPELRIKPILCDWPDYEVVSEQVFNPPKETKDDNKEDDSLFGIKLPSRKSSPKKVAAQKDESEEAQAGPATVELVASGGDAGAAPVASDAVAAMIQTALNDALRNVPSSDELAEAMRQSMSEGMAGVIAALREELALGNGGAVAAGDGGRSSSGSGLSAVERKLETLANSVAQIAQASDVFQAARKAEEHMVAEGLRADLLGGATGGGHGVRELKQGDAPLLGPQGDAAVKAQLDTGAPLGGYSFDSFFAGEVNSVTRDIAKAVAESPGNDYNPLFLCGDVGLGKTHLVNAIGNHLTETRPDIRVGYTSASRFADHVATSLQQQMTKAFREAYSQWDVLILDDVQFLGGHVEAQEEFFHLFNTLQQGGRQIIIAGDKPPQKLGLLEERLISRFEGGMVAHLLAPDWETRMEILRHYSNTKDKVPEEVLAMVAATHPNDVRRLIGCLQKILAYAELKGDRVSCELANQILIEAAVEAA